MNALWQDLRHGTRMLLKNPGFTSVAIITLGVGIAANTAVFSLVYAVLLRELPYRKPEQLIKVTADFRALDLRDVGLSVPELADLRNESNVFAAISAVSPENENLTEVDRPQRIELLVVNADYFSLLGAEPEMGRTFGPEDSVPGFSENVVISDAMWRNRFGAASNILGRRLRLDNDISTVIGVMPADFRHPGPTLQGDTEVWSAAGWTGPPFPTPRRDLRSIREAIGRLKPGITVSQAQAQLETFAANLRLEYPQFYPTDVRWSPRVVPLQEAIVGNVRPLLLALAAAVGFVLLIGCVNIANLLLSRAWARRREMAVRRALGAGRGRLVVQMLTESLLLSLTSGAAGLFASFLVLRLLLLFVPAKIPRVNEIHVNATVLGFLFAVSVITGLMFGLIPAIRAAEPNLADDLKEGTRGSGAGVGHSQARRLLVIFEFALSFALMVGGGLLVRTFLGLLSTDPGFNPRQLLVARTWLPAPNDQSRAPYFQLAKRTAFIREALDRASSLQGVERVAVATSVPLGTDRNTAYFSVEDQPLQSSQNPVVEFVAISPQYLAVMETPLLRGRFFTESDDDRGAPVAIVDQNFAQRFWPEGDALGKRIRPEERGRLLRGSGWQTIVGVIGNIRTDGLDIQGTPHVYLSIFQHSDYGLTLFLRTRSNPRILMNAAGRVFESLDPGLPVFGVRTMEEIITGALAEWRFSAELVGAFAMVALTLAAVGIYGVMAYIAGRRAHEIAVRVALGAQSRDVLRLLLREGMSMALIGLGLGVGVAMALMRLMSGLLFGVKASDPVTFSMVSILLVTMAFLACYVPSNRAARVDPVIALRNE